MPQFPSLTPCCALLAVLLQTADRGIISVIGGGASSDGGSAATGEGATLRVGSVNKAAGGALSVHSAEVLSGELHVGSKVRVWARGEGAGVGGRRSSSTYAPCLSP